MNANKGLRVLLKIVYLISFIIFPVFVMELAGQPLTNLPLRMVFFCVLVAAGAWVFRQAWTGQGWGKAILVTSLGYATAYKLASFIPDVSTYPFSLNWSEASRYYYASLWLSKLIYGTSLPPSVLHPSRYLMQALPFLVPHVSLVVLRIWQVLLWIGTAALTSWLLVRRLHLAAQKRAFIITMSMLLWAFLFLFQGPIYYHLLAMVILVLWGFNRQHFWRSMVIVLVASLWAGISRVNWLPVPGFLAAALYLLETPAKGKPLVQYLIPPAAWALAGTAIGYASQEAYKVASGNPPAWFGSSFTSDLLWYRLLPNPTYPLGILPSAILVSLPLVGLILLRLYNRWREFHFIRLLGLAAILLILFTGGVVVSIKIGGGSNLHNLDAYLSLLLVIGSYIYFDRFIPDNLAAPESELAQQPTAPGKLARTIELVLVGAAIAIPLYYTLSVGGALPQRDFATAQANMQAIDTATQDVANKGGKVLFISQRQLLTFDNVTQVPLVPDDELVFLMEMAMSGNSDYLEAFHNDISHQRFAMIVSEPLTTQLQGRSHSFGEENDAWVEQVSKPILCYYEPSEQLEAAGVILYTPRATPCQ